MVAVLDYYASMRAFAWVVELGSFSKAAARGGLKVSTVSRHVSGLEADLGAALFNRSTRRMHLTEAGANFYEKVTRILADIEEARLEASSSTGRPQGLLRVNLPGSFGRRHVIPHLREFLTTYPDIRMEATLTEETVDLIATGTDVAIRIGVLADSTLMARKLASHDRVLVASVAYLASQPVLTKPGMLRHRECLMFAFQPKDSWYFTPRHQPDDEPTEVPVHGRLRFNDSDALLEAARAGLGFALLPTWLVADDVSTGNLAVVLPGWQAFMAPETDRAIWAVYPPKRSVTASVRVFISFLEGRFGRPPYWDAFRSA